jgi:hypothetical protein
MYHISRSLILILVIELQALKRERLDITIDVTHVRKLSVKS